MYDMVCYSGSKTPDFDSIFVAVLDSAWTDLEFLEEEHFLKDRAQRRT